MTFGGCDEQHLIRSLRQVAESMLASVDT